MAVRIRMKKLGRKRRPFYRICAMDSRSPRDGRAIEELGTYDPMIRDVDARAVLNGERIQYWMSVGALPSEKVGVLIRKYGTEGTHLSQQKEALERLALQRSRSDVYTSPSISTSEESEEPDAETPTATPEPPEADEPAAEGDAS